MTTTLTKLVQEAPCCNPAGGVASSIKGAPPDRANMGTSCSGFVNDDGLPARSQTSCEEAPLRRSTRHQRLHAERMALGLCCRCGKEPLSARSTRLGETCRIIQRADEKRLRRRRKLAGLCRECGEPTGPGLDMKPQTFCDLCLARKGVANEVRCRKLGMVRWDGRGAVPWAVREGVVSRGSVESYSEARLAYASKEVREEGHLWRDRAYELVNGRVK